MKYIYKITGKVSLILYIFMSVSYTHLPHKICAYIYDLSKAFNHFYHETKIMAEEDAAVQAGYIRLLELTKSALEICIDPVSYTHL